MRKTTHVLPNGKGRWKVMQGGAQRATAILGTQQEAINRARDLSQRQHSELVIHRPNGQIRQCDSHGNDPCPPKDKK